MPKPIRVTDTNNSFQKSSEGEVSFGRLFDYSLIDINLYNSFFETADSRKPIVFDRFPVDDEHEVNKI